MFPVVFYIAISVCVALLAALVLVLKRLYALESVAKSNAPQNGAGDNKLDELLSMLLSLQEKGVSNSGAVSREEFGQTVLDCACRMMNCERGSVMLWSEKEKGLEIVAAYPVTPNTDKHKKFFLKADEGVAGKAFTSAKPVFVENPRTDSRYQQSKPDDNEPFVSLPLLIKGKSIGVLNLHSKAGAKPFNDYSIKFLSILAGESAVMIHNMDLFDSLQTFYLEMVQTLARAVDSKDAYTHEHSDRARVKARRVALEMNMPEQMVRYVEYAALLHDIGKIGIDEAILLKPGKLTPEEYEQMKKHPIIGHQILAPVKYLGPVAQMVLYHQEWFDGRGYPEGLKGEAIPLGSRIVAVLDAWDAMTSDRPYRKALGRDIAIGELRKGSGTQFDPNVVETFLKLESTQWQNEKTGS